VHGDLCGPVTPATPGGRCYFLLPVDDLSRYMWVMVLGSKREAMDAIRRTQAAAEAECGRKLCVLRTNNSGEFTTTEFTSYCTDKGVQHRTTHSRTTSLSSATRRLWRWLGPCSSRGE
jgi:hypothetical protein